MTESGEHDDDLADDAGEEESPVPARATSKRIPQAASKPAVVAKPALLGVQAIGFGLIALAVGAAAGWFGQIQKTKAALRADIAATPLASAVPAGPCGAWQTKICASTGAQSVPCQQAKGALDLLLPSTCATALASMPETLARVKAARASCEKLVGKICKDLPPDSKVCDMVKERTPSFPTERCNQMLQTYDQVIGELKQMDLHDRPEADQLRAAQQMSAKGMLPSGMPGGAPRVSIPQSAPRP